MGKAISIFWVLLVLLLPVMIYAQAEHSLNELKYLLSQSKRDKNRVHLLLDLGKSYLYKIGEYEVDLDSAALLAKQAEELSRSLQYKSGVYESYYLTGNIFLERNNPGPAIALLPHTQDTSKIKLTLQIGGHYLYKYIYKPNKNTIDLDSAALFFHEGKRLSESLGSDKFKNESLRFLVTHSIAIGDTLYGKNYLDEMIRSSETKEAQESAAKILMEFGTGAYRQSKLFDESLYSLEQARLFYQQLGEQEASTLALKEMADINLIQGKLDESEKKLLEVIELYKKIGFQNLHYTYDLLTEVNTRKGNLNKALYYAMETIKSMEATGDGMAAKNFYWRLGNIYQELGQLEKSVEWQKKALEKSENIEHAVYGRVTMNMIKLGRPKEALALISNAVRKSAPATDYQKSCVAYAMGNCYNALGQYDVAEKYFLEMIHFEKLLENQNAFTSLVNLTIGDFYVNRHRYQTAEPYLKNVLAIPQGMVTIQRLKDTQLLLFKIDSAAGKYLQAIQHFQLYKILNDSLFNETKSKQIEELQIQYETEQKEKDIQLLQNESQLQQSQLLQANLTKNITFGGITLLIIIVGLLYNRYRLKQRSNRQLEIQQIEINQTNRSLQNLLEEKEWLLKEIHHRVKNNLQIVMSLLNTQSNYLANDAALSAIRDSQHRIHSISLIHKKLYQSDNVAQIDMPNYIQELVEYLQDSFDTNYNIHFDLNIEPIELDVTQAVPLGLILNEAISNAIKYAFPNRKGLINITMQQVDEESYSLIIADNGVGLPPDFDVNKSNSLGMSLMKGLSKQLNGSFELRNENGLTIHIAFANEVISKPFIKLNEMQLSA
ncbi:MAG: histidine kinase dimerization/phosphoacceptor domain -containing protein [Saprospiraceae bacterium]|nr:histidine kinase dimerization/phosphoacceptor domain -containing protein [Saprospiraceae bacterium]